MQAEATPGDVISSVHVRYARKLPFKAARLGALVSLLRAVPGHAVPGHATPAEAVLLERARREAHQLKGTSAAYGFAAVSRSAERIEEMLHQDEAVLDWLELGGRLDDLLAVAKAQCESALAAAEPDSRP